MIELTGLHLLAILVINNLVVGGYVAMMEIAIRVVVDAWVVVVTKLGASNANTIIVLCHMIEYGVCRVVEHASA